MGGQTTGQVNKGFCSSQIRSRTSCKWRDVKTPSAIDPAAHRRNHVRSVGGQTAGYRQLWILRLSDEITYSLQVDGRRNPISYASCSSHMRSRTFCRGIDDQKPSPMDSVGDIGDHILSVGRQTTIHSERLVLQLTNRITYCL